MKRQIVILIFLLPLIRPTFAQSRIFKLTDNNVKLGDTCSICPIWAVGGHPISQETIITCDSIRTFLKNNKTVSLELKVCSDIRGSVEVNDTITTKRALALKDYILKDTSIVSNRLTAIGCGERFPIVVTSEINKIYKFLPVGKILNEDFISTLPTREQREIAYTLNRRTILIITKR